MLGIVPKREESILGQQVFFLVGTGLYRRKTSMTIWKLLENNCKGAKLCVKKKKKERVNDKSKVKQKNGKLM